MAIEKTKATEQGEAPADAQVLSSEAAARRHLLLKGLGRGSAVLAASIPLKTLAHTSVFTNPGANGAAVINCTCSGMKSGVHSQNTNARVCTGHSPKRYCTAGNWPKSLNCNAKVTAVFPSCKLVVNKAGTSLGSYRVPTCLEVMNLNPSVDECDWITAWVDASGGAPGSWNYPYTAAQVQAFYAGAGSGGNTKAQAHTFFKTYMQTHS